MEFSVLPVILFINKNVYLKKKTECNFIINTESLTCWNFSMWFRENTLNIDQICLNICLHKYIKMH